MPVEQTDKQLLVARTGTGDSITENTNDTTHLAVVTNDPKDVQEPPQEMRATEKDAIILAKATRATFDVHKVPTDIADKECEAENKSYSRAELFEQFHQHLWI